MNVKTRIRKIAAKKVVVKITSRKRSLFCFAVKAPDGTMTVHANKKEALQSLLAQLRCSEVRVWKLVEAPF